MIPVIVQFHNSILFNSRLNINKYIYIFKILQNIWFINNNLGVDQQSIRSRTCVYHVDSRTRYETRVLYGEDVVI